MRLNGLKNALFVTALVTMVGAGIYAQGQAAPQARTPQNLQVLPKDLTLQQVQQTMRGFTAALGVPTTGTENYGGPLVTAGGILFIGATIFDRKFRAFDKKNGKRRDDEQKPKPRNAKDTTDVLDDITGGNKDDK